MKLLSRLVIALAICLMAIPMMATPVQAAGISGMSLHPSKGTVGEEVYITGSCIARDDYWVYYQLDTDDWVQVLDDDEFDFYSVVVGEYDYETEKFEIPESCSGKHEIAICDKDLDDEVDDDADIEDHKEYSRDFTVEPKVEIVEIAGDEIDDPEDAKGSMGIEVKVKGTGFGEDEEDINILFDGEVVSEEEFKANGYGTWEGTFLVPTASKGDHDVSAEGEDTVEDDVEKATFEVMPGISLDTVEGSPGDTITVTGSGFEEDEKNIKVTYDDVVVAEVSKATEDGTWEVTFEVPESVKGKHEIDASGYKTDAKYIADKDFTVVTKLVLSPTEGHVGTTLTVSGAGFPKNKAVTITYAGASQGSKTTDSNGSLPAISFEAKGMHGKQTIKATYDSAILSAEFTMESKTPAVPTLTSPATGERVGFVGRKFTPTFTWSAVTDDSGVSYNLQVGMSADFAQVIVSKTGLTETSYTLTQEEALPYGTYYWRVKAIDGAQNDSGWSAPYSFKSGFLPFWALIAIAALLAVLIGVLVYLFVRKRAPYD